MPSSGHLLITTARDRALGSSGPGLRQYSWFLSLPVKRWLHQSENGCRCLNPAVSTETLHESCRKSFWCHYFHSGESAAFGGESPLPSCSSCLIRMSVPWSALEHGGHPQQVSLPSLFHKLVCVSVLEDTTGADKNEVVLLLILT